MTANSKNQILFDNLKWPLLVYSALACLYTVNLSDKFKWFSWHPISMIVGFIAMASNAALMFNIIKFHSFKYNLIYINYKSILVRRSEAMITLKHTVT